MIEALVVVLIVVFVPVAVWTIIYTLTPKSWWRPYPVERRFRKTVERRERAERIQLLEHELGMMPHSDEEMVHLCRTCEQQEELEAALQAKVDESWAIHQEPWDGKWQPARMGRNLYQDLMKPEEYRK